MTAVTKAELAQRKRDLESAVRKAIIHLIDAETEEIVPQLRPDLTFTYGGISSIAKSYGVSAEAVLAELQRMGLLKSRVFKKVVRCPRCGSTKILSQFACPSCGSINVAKVTLISHIPCGYIGVLEELEVKDGKRICKKCGKPLGKEGEDYIVMGTLFLCKSCASRFDAPHPKYECANCLNVFDHMEADYHTVYSYIVNREALGKLAARILIEMVKDELERLGLKVQENVEARGVSGLVHRTDLVVSGSKDKVYIDIVQEGSDPSDMLAIFGKHVDLGHPKHIVAAPERLMAKSPFQAKSPNLRVIGYTSLSEAVKKIVDATVEELKP